MAHQVAMYFQSGNSQTVISHPLALHIPAAQWSEKTALLLSGRMAICGITQLRCGLLFSFFSLHIFVVFNFPSWCSKKVMGRELAGLAQIKLWKLGLLPRDGGVLPYSFFRISENDRKVAYRKNILRRWHFRNLGMSWDYPQILLKGQSLIPHMGKPLHKAGCLEHQKAWLT